MLAPVVNPPHDLGKEEVMRLKVSSVLGLVIILGFFLLNLANKAEASTVMGAMM